MRLTHDDRLRAFKARLDTGTAPANAANPEALAEPAAQLTPAMVNRARALTAPHLVRASTLRRFRLADGAMRDFLRTARAVQNLPSFGKGRRE